MYWEKNLNSQFPYVAHLPLPNIPKQEIYKEPSFVEVVSNRIYFYSEIGPSEILQLNKKINELNNNLLIDAITQSREPASIFLHVHSYGGSVFSGLSAMDEIKNSKVPITTIVDGCCASAATFLTFAGKTRLIHENSFMLIHQISGGFWGKFNELEDEHENHVKIMKTIKTITEKYTKIPSNKIEEILQHDLWFDSKKCIEYGLADDII